MTREFYLRFNSPEFQRESLFDATRLPSIPTDDLGGELRITINQELSRRQYIHPQVFGVSLGGKQEGESVIVIPKGYSHNAPYIEEALHLKYEALSEDSSSRLRRLARLFIGNSST